MLPVLRAAMACGLLAQQARGSGAAAGADPPFSTTARLPGCGACPTAGGRGSGQWLASLAGGLCGQRCGHQEEEEGDAALAAALQLEELEGGATRGLSADVLGVEDTTACPSCMESCPTASMVRAGADAALFSGGAPAGCSHLFCEGCMREYVRGAVRARTYPLPCPMAGSGCTVALSHDAAAELLAGDADDVKALGLLAAESAIPPDQRVYCPHKDCSMLLVRPDKDHAADEPITCPACSRVFCLHCRIPGWHKGFTCAQFQALPPDQRSAEDAAVLHLSQQQGWKRCPNATCRLLVGRVDGCNHMKCRCGSDFCYACGSPYTSKIPTANNVHGTPGCTCTLFAVPR